MKRILVLRFSAMGDVALLVPVLQSLVAAHHDVEVTLVTRPKFAAFFHSIERVTVFEADVDHEYAGFFGMRNLFRVLLRKGFYDVVIDVHDHIRTMFLRNLFKLAGTRVVAFRKGRKEKKSFTRKEKKVTKPLPHTIERYTKAFEKAGFTFSIKKSPYFYPTEKVSNLLEAWLKQSNLVKLEKWIGIAPFALHTSKIWPLANYPKLLDSILKETNAKFFMFGGGEKETAYFEDLKELFPTNLIVVAGQLTLRQEMALMQKLDLMLCVDSSNMHLAMLAGAPLLSIWGGTHPDVGFGPYGYAEDSILQISTKDLPCRPCSVFGKETCHRGDFACMNHIEITTIKERVLKKIGK
jgi:ADP-heptose:LPS heptosyltransferase